MRLIDADALLEAMKTDVMGGLNYRHFIEEAPTIEPMEWIPCNKRMPEEYEWVGTKKFGTTISDPVMITFESNGERFVKMMRLQNGEPGRANARAMDVVYGEWKMLAWAPSPKPWKGADDEA
jgi:hypothetical protein